MKAIDPSFDIFKLEQEAKVIFERTYEAFLKRDLNTLHAVCSEGALSYFKILIN